MLKALFITSILISIAGVLPVGDASAWLPDRLAQKLRQQNFDLHPAPSPAHDMALRTLNGTEIDLSSLRGKVILLNFWKIDSPSCSAERPILERIHRKLANLGLSIIAVNLADRLERQRSYLKRHGVAYTFAFDPQNRFSMRRDSQGSGSSSSFVLNADSHAIYEVPSYPTTYVINKKGEVVGSSSGKVNWDEGAVAKLLDWLLNESAGTLVQTVRDFEEVAGQGSGPSSLPHPAIGPRRRTPAPSDQMTAPRPPSATLPAESQPSLPFHGPVGPAPPGAAFPSGVAPVSQEPAPPSAVTGESARPKSSRKVTRAKKKPERAQVARPAEERRTPKPFVPSPPVPAPSQVQPALPPFGAQRPAPPAVPPVDQASADVPPIPGGSPPLPPALPYTPPGAEGQAPSVASTPDANGTVLARVPGQAAQYPAPAYPVPGPGDSRGLPPAQPTGQTNPLDGFILDSFKTPQQPPPSQIHPVPVGVPQQQEGPAGSVLHQLSRDFRQLGDGIRQVLSGILPGPRGAGAR